VRVDDTRRLSSAERRRRVGATVVSAAVHHGRDDHSDALGAAGLGMMGVGTAPLIVGERKAQPAIVSVGPHQIAIITFCPRRLTTSSMRPSRSEASRRPRTGRNRVQERPVLEQDVGRRLGRFSSRPSTSGDLTEVRVAAT
jgi:hypothetical protein